MYYWSDRDFEPMPAEVTVPFRENRYNHGLANN